MQEVFFNKNHAFRTIIEHKNIFLINIDIYPFIVKFGQRFIFKVSFIPRRASILYFVHF